MDTNNRNAQAKWRGQLYDIIFQSDTIAGKTFDVILFVLIFASIITINIESISSIYVHHINTFKGLEIFFTLVFTLEYILRIIAVRSPKKYVTSFYGIIDLLAIAPTYLAILFPSLHFLLIIRSLRLLRIFRIFKLAHFLVDSNTIINALWKSRRKIFVFFFAVILITIVLGSMMYVIEAEVNEGFSNIPQSIYWAIVTLTTVGYGDISPVTPLGKFLASFIMLLGYSIIAVPTGIVSAGIAEEMANVKNRNQRCSVCHHIIDIPDAVFCPYCGNEIEKHT